MDSFDEGTKENEIEEWRETKNRKQRNKKKILAYKHRGLQRVFFLGMLVDQPNKKEK